MDDLLQCALQSAQLEIQFESIKHEAARLYDEERARILRVNWMLAEDTNDQLQDDIQQIEDVELKRSEMVAEDLRTRLSELEELYNHSQAELKACIHDIDHYQTELNAMNLATTDSSKVLAEKLALTRELNILKPELDHLRSLASTQDNILADKLSLQRELATAQVELDNERKTIERLRQRNVADNTFDEVEDLRQELAERKKQVQKLERQNVKRVNEKSTADAALVDELEALKEELNHAKRRAQNAEQALQEAVSQNENTRVHTIILEQLRQELAKERKAFQKIERDQIKKSSEWDAEKQNLEGKLDAFRNKLRSTKEQLKEAQDEIERRETAKFAESAAATKARINGRARSASVEPTQHQVPKKRQVARFDPDMTIGTPGNGGPAAKKPRLTASTVGDKSTFSITPFLNRTLTILPEVDSPNAAVDTTINELAEEADHEAAASKVKSKPAAKKMVAGKKTSHEKEPLKDVSSRVNTVKIPEMRKVTEESSAADQCSNASKPLESQETILPPKKKKLLGTRRNIFDDDEPDGVKKMTKAGFGKINLGVLGKNKPKLLAEFSPLKKDRPQIVV